MTSAKVFIIGKETASCRPLKEGLDGYGIETVFLRKMQELRTTAHKQTADALVFLETLQAQEWMDLGHRFPPALLLPECFPPPLPFQNLAEANIGLMPRETDGPVLAKRLFLGIELHRFQKSIADLNAENQKALLSIFEEFRHTFSGVCLQIHGLMNKLEEYPPTLLELRAVVHRLAGSLGSYGFMALSHTAKAIESAIANKASLQIQTLTHNFLEMLSWLLPPPSPPCGVPPLVLIYNPGQQNLSQYLYALQNRGLHSVWGMDWVECWKWIQTYTFSEALFHMENLPLASWPPLFEALNSSAAFAALPKRLLKQNANEAEKACAALLHCLGPNPLPATAEAFAQMLQSP